MNKKNRVLVLSGLFCLSFVFPLFMAGCSKAPFKVVPIEGTLLYKGEPLANCNMEFKPNDGRMSVAVTDENGKFKALYSNTTDGIQVGETHLFVMPSGKVTGPGIKQLSKKEQELKNKYGYGTQGFSLTIEKSNKNMVIEIP